MTGVFISKGMKVSIPVGGLQISVGPSGSLEGSVQLRLHFDVVPCWTALALKHLADAHNDKLARDQAWRTPVEADKGLTLDPILHPELGVGVEWRFFYFRFDHALPIVRSVVETVHAGNARDARERSDQGILGDANISVQFVQGRTGLEAGLSGPLSNGPVCLPRKQMSCDADTTSKSTS